MCAPQFRCAQLWPHAHNPAPHPQQRVCEANWRRTTSAASLLRKHALAVDCPAGQSLCAPQFRCAQLWPHAHNPHHIGRNSVFAKQTGGAQRSAASLLRKHVSAVDCPAGQSLCAPSFAALNCGPTRTTPHHPQQRVCESKLAAHNERRQFASQTRLRLIALQIIVLPSFAALNCGPTRTTPHSVFAKPHNELCARNPPGGATRGPHAHNPAHIRNSVFAKQTGGAQRAPPVCFANAQLYCPHGQ